MTYLSALGCFLSVLPAILPLMRAAKIHSRIADEDYNFKLNCSEREAPDSDWYRRVEIYLRPMKSLRAGHHPISETHSVHSYTRVRCTEFGRDSKISATWTMGFVPQPVLSDL